MTDPWKLRDLGEGDLTWMAACEREFFGPSAWSEDVIRHDWRHGGRRYRGAEVGGELVGYAVYGFDGDAFSLMNVAVVPAWRRRGLGRAFVDDFLGEARSFGVDAGWLEVAVTNHAARAMYEGAGFVEIRRRVRYYQPEGVDAVVMRRDMKEPGV